MAVSIPTPEAPSFSMTAVQVRHAVRDAILELELGLSESGLILGPESDPDSLGDGRFSILIPSETNLGTQRDRRDRYIHLNQDLTVRVVKRVRPNVVDQLDDFDRALHEIPTRIVQKLCEWDGGHMPGIEAKYVGTDRDVIHRGTWLIIDIQFGVEHLLSVSSGVQ